MNGVLIKLDPSIDGFRYILNECMRDSFSHELEVTATIENFRLKKCELWTVPGVGFIIVSLHEYATGGRWLDVDYAAGRGLYHPDNMNALYKMAAGYDCNWIGCSTLKRGNVRLLKRAGFIVDKVKRGRTYLIRILNDGQQIKKFDGQHNEHYNNNDKSKCNCRRGCNKCNRWRRVSGRYRANGFHRITSGSIV